MIVYPQNWRKVGVPITMSDIDRAMRKVIEDIDCSNLSFSGGIDSSLLLYYLLEAKRRVRTFTVANDAHHPDIEFSHKSLQYFESKYKTHIDHCVLIRTKLDGDDLVKAFYGVLSTSFSVKAIITGDCIDELSCGYYQHQDLEEATYHNFLNRLQAEHLTPLNENSGDIRVYLPYADDRVANMFYRIPLYEKVSILGRKLVIQHLAEGKVLPEVIERRKYGFAANINKIAV